jgi:hypothetical protein
MPANPAVVANLDFSRILDVVAPRLNLCFMSGCKNADKGSKHDAITDGYYAAIEYDGTISSVSPGASSWAYET